MKNESPVVHPEEELKASLEWDAPDISLGQVDDDFPLGNACGLEHEECESCQ